MTKYTWNDIIRIVGTITMWALAAIIGFTVFTTVAGLVIAFASTGIGAVILAIIAVIWWKKHYNNQSD